MELFSIYFDKMTLLQVEMWLTQHALRPFRSFTHQALIKFISQLTYLWVLLLYFTQFGIKMAEMSCVWFQVAVSNLKVSRLVVERSPAAEAGLEVAGFVVCPAELPPLHRVRCRFDAHVHCFTADNPLQGKKRLVLTETVKRHLDSDFTSLFSKCPDCLCAFSNLRDASTQGWAHSFTQPILSLLCINN